METAESVQLFLHFLIERHEKLKTRTDELLHNLSLEDKNSKIKSCENTYIAAQDLLHSLSSRDQPPWLNTLINSLNVYKANQDRNSANYNLLLSIIAIYHDIKSYRWRLEKSNPEAPYDFDAIYERFRENSRLPALFDGAIEILEKMAPR